MKCDQAAAERGVAGAVIVWARGRKGALSAKEEDRVRLTLSEILKRLTGTAAEKVPVPKSGHSNYPFLTLYNMVFGKGIS